MRHRKRKPGLGSTVDENDLQIRDERDDTMTVSEDHSPKDGDNSQEQGKNDSSVGPTLSKSFTKLFSNAGRAIKERLPYSKKIQVNRDTQTREEKRKKWPTKEQAAEELINRVNGRVIKDENAKPDQGKKLERFIEAIKEEVQKLPLTALTDDNLKLIEKMIFPWAFGQKGIYASEIDDFVYFRKMTRMKGVLHNLVVADERLRRYKSDIQGLASIEGTVDENDLTIELTGSDPHHEGKTVCIIKLRDESIAVYKPRDMTGDERINGEGDSYYSKINERLDADYKLPLTKRFIPEEQPPDEKFGFEEFIRHEVELGDEKSAAYDKRLGVLAIVAKVLGIGDLHQENIIATSEGPKVIDLEVAYNPQIINTPGLEATQLQMAMLEYMHPSTREMTPNAWISTTERNDPNINEENLVEEITKRRKESYKNGGTGYTNFKLGVTSALNALQGADGLEINTGGTMTRIVPIKTAEFMSLEHNIVDRDYGLDQIKQNINNNLKRKYFTPIPEATLDDLLRLDIDGTDIPIFYYSPTEGKIFYKGQEVSVYEGRPPRIGVAGGFGAKLPDPTNDGEITAMINKFLQL
jgi:hypothetical protein